MDAIITYHEFGNIQHAWVRLAGEPARCVGRRGEPESELIARAERAAKCAAHQRTLEIELRRRYPGRQIYTGFLPADDTHYDGPAGEYIYILRRRRRRGKYLIEISLPLNPPK